MEIVSPLKLRVRATLHTCRSVSFGSDNFTVEGHVRVHFVSGGGSNVLLHTDSEQHIGECTVQDELGREILVKHVSQFLWLPTCPKCFVPF